MVSILHYFYLILGKTKPNSLVTIKAPTTHVNVKNLSKVLLTRWTIIYHIALYLETNKTHFKVEP